MCYTDGVQLVSSSSHQCWPVVLSLVEFPCIIRDSNLNKVICGIWFGRQKPTTDVLFGQLTAQLDMINRTGLAISFQSNDFHLSFGLYGLLADTPAKSMCMNITNFNGHFGCPYCLNPGNSFIFKITALYLLVILKNNVLLNYCIRAV